MGDQIIVAADCAQVQPDLNQILLREVPAIFADVIGGSA
jgi:hypothetical protein